MPSYTVPTDDMQFLLHEVLELGDRSIPGYEDLDRAFTKAVLDEAGKLATEVLAPLNAVGDMQGCTLSDGSITTPDGFRDAYRELCKGGWPGLDLDPAFGGQGMPYLLGTAVGEMFVSANMAFNIYQGLTHGAAAAIHAHGTEDQKRTWLPNMIAGTWSGTMNLTEPQAGTDLGLIRTRAELQDDGTFRITGQKIFISAGEHDLTENIVHLVLAKAAGGGEGTRGISLFIVPKFLLDEDGKPGARNAVTCTRLETKMGIHGNATCEMHYDGATGHLLGRLHDGMRAMFTMMNEARIGVGLQGYAQASVAYQNARDYALDRLQGRAVAGAENPDSPADPLIVHPDVRRLLLEQKSFVEGARAFTFWGAHLIDRAARAGDRDAEGMVSLLTPVIKGFLTDKGFEMTVLAQQVFGGHGYVEDTGMAQFVRDARIAMIYEGANGVQALDLVGRKLGQDGGRHMMAFFEEVKTFARENEDHPELRAAYLEPLTVASRDLQTAAMYFMQDGMKEPNAALAGSSDFMHLFGHVCLGLMWAWMARASLRALESGTGDAAFHRAKLETGRFYMTRMLPATALHLARIRSGADPVMTLEAAQF